MSNNRHKIMRDRTDFLISEITRHLTKYGCVKPFLARELDAHLELVRAYYLTDSTNN